MSHETSSSARRAIGAIHSRAVFGRRVRTLASAIARMLPEEATVLDVGCGSGDIASALLEMKPRLRIEGVDVLVRPQTAIPVRQFDGSHLPFPDSSFDYAILVDVLHHTDDPSALVAEVSRVARNIVIKDHYRNGFLAGARLRFMDWVGNAPHDVRLPYNYLSQADWARVWERAELRLVEIDEDLPLYPFPSSLAFGRGLHFLAKVGKQ